MLNTAPSFSIYHATDGVEGEIEEHLEREGLTLGKRVGSTGSFTFEKIVTSNMTLIEEREDEQEQEQEQEQEEGAKENGDLGIGLGRLRFDDVAGDEEYYKKMVDENPSNALFLGKYAKILESNGDLEGADEYYFRAAFVDPNDGEILMLYAKLVWKLHRDRERAQDYFERAILVSPQDSDVLAAYAHFQWEFEEDNGEDFQENDQNKVGGGNPIEDANSEGYFKRMVDENPESSFALRNYAQFLYKTKGDVKAAEDTYSRAILADPTNGEAKSEYAQLIWENHRDRSRALFCFEQAVSASPQDSNVLAAYARFLWEAGEDEENNA